MDTVELNKVELITHFSSFLKQFHYVAQAGLELLTFLSVPLEYWDYKLWPPRPVQHTVFIKGTAESMVFGDPDSFHLMSF